MSRLTELINIDGMKIKTSKERPLSNQGLCTILHKLYALEDLEDELGCSLEVVFKALKEGILVNDIMFIINGEESSKTIFREIIFTYNKFYKDYGFDFGMDENGENPLWWISLKDYGKTWWLKEDRSE